MIDIKKVDLYVLRYPIQTPVRTSFGVMHDRPAVLVRVENNQGVFGWGEVWCNFPTCGAEHRYALCKTVVAPLLLENTFESPDHAFAEISRKTHILALQCREPGPLANTIAGVTGAIWDLCAREAGQPLFRLLAGQKKDAPTGFIPAYASGINSAGAAETVVRQKAAGFNRFKVKIGFNFKDDLKIIEDVLGLMEKTDTLCVDVNQGWTLDEARERIAVLAEYPLGWIEEPIASDHGPLEFAELSRINSSIPIAGGENVYGLDEFKQYTRIHALGVVQPDACKWGGPGMCLAVARATLDVGLTYCPHFLGAGIGLWTSGQILAAAGGPGQLEVDINHNPLQNMLGMPRPSLENGGYQLPETPGIGVEPDIVAAADYIRQQDEIVR